VVPGESRNDLIDFPATIKGDDRLCHLMDLLQPLRLPEPKDGQRINQFTDTAYRDINFVVDMPVRLDDSVTARTGLVPERDGRVVFALVEFQVVDRKSHQRNNQGKSRHTLYKARQRERAFLRLKPGES
jgi:uncharacterized protein (TIGR04552 family)